MNERTSVRRAAVVAGLGVALGAGAFGVGIRMLSARDARRTRSSERAPVTAPRPKPTPLRPPAVTGALATAR